MTYVQFPYETLVALGQNLTSLSEQLQGEERGAYAIAGLSTETAAIEQAIEDFRGEWKTSLLELTTNIGSWGGLSAAIGKLVADFDAQVAAALRPGE